VLKLNKLQAARTSSPGHGGKANPRVAQGGAQSRHAVTLDMAAENPVSSRKEDFTSQWKQYKQCLQQSCVSSASLDSE